MSNPYDKDTVTHSSVLGPTLKFKGKLTANENLLIHGQIEGSIKHSSLLTVGKEGKLKANVSAEYIAIDGNVVGDLAGTKSVVVSKGADVTGNIYSPIVTLREGATFNGSIDMTGKAKADAGSKKAQASDVQARQPASDERTEDKAAQDESKPDASAKKSANAA